MNIHKIFISNTLLLVVKAIMPLVLTPIFLSTWGGATYSEWLIFLSYLAFLGLYDLGLSNYSITHIHLRKSKKIRTAKIFNLLTSIHISLSFFILVVFCIFIFLVNQLTDNFSIHILIMLGLVTIFSVINGYINSISRIYNNQHHAVYISLIYNTINYLGIYILLKLQADQISVASWMLFSVSLSIFAIYNFIIRKYNLSFKYLFSIRVYKAYINRSIFYLLYKLTAILKVHFPIIIISAINPINIVIFTLHRAIVNIQTQILNLINNSILQDLTRSNALFSNIVFIYLLIFGITAISISVITHSIYEYIFPIWIGDGYENYFSRELMLLFLFHGLAHILWFSLSIFLVSKNDHELLSKKVLSYTFISNLLSIPGYFYFGLYGFMWSMIFLETILGQFWLQRFILHKLNINFLVPFKAYLVLAGYLFLLIGINFLTLSIIFKILIILLAFLTSISIIISLYKEDLLSVFKH